MTDSPDWRHFWGSLQKIKSIKNPIEHFIIIFYFIKSETSDSFVNHFDGHFAYLKTLDFYFKLSDTESLTEDSQTGENCSSQGVKEQRQR